MFWKGFCLVFIFLDGEIFVFFGINFFWKYRFIFIAREDSCMKGGVFIGKEGFGF